MVFKAQTAYGGKTLSSDQRSCGILGGRELCLKSWSPKKRNIFKNMMPVTFLHPWRSQESWIIKCQAYIWFLEVDASP